MLQTSTGALIHWAPSRLPLFVVPHPSMFARRAPVHQACGFWNELIGQTVVLCLAPTEIPPAEIRPFEGPVVALPSESTGAWLHVDEETGVIVFGLMYIEDTKNMPPSMAFLHAARAMGFALGLAQDNPAIAPNSLMQRDIASADIDQLWVEPADIRILRQVYGPIPVAKSPKKLGI